MKASKFIKLVFGVLIFQSGFSQNALNIRYGMKSSKISETRNVKVTKTMESIIDGVKTKIEEIENKIIPSGSTDETPTSNLAISPTLGYDGLLDKVNALRPTIQLIGSGNFALVSEKVNISAMVNVVTGDHDARDKRALYSPLNSKASFTTELVLNIKEWENKFPINFFTSINYSTKSFEIDTFRSNGIGVAHWVFGGEFILFKNGISIYGAYNNYQVITGNENFNKLIPNNIGNKSITWSYGINTFLSLTNDKSGKLYLNLHFIHSTESMRGIIGNQDKVLPIIKANFIKSFSL